MVIFVERTTKQCYGSLFGQQPFQFPSWAQGSQVPLEVIPVDLIQTGSTFGSQSFQPVSGGQTWTIKAALGNGYTPSLAGQFFIQSGISLTSGTVLNGKSYLIINFVAGDNFTNIGGVNASAQVFTASGTTPTTWTNGSTLQEITANLQYNSTASQIQTALNATGWLVSGCTVTQQGTAFLAQWNTAGAQTTMIGNGGGLAPLSIVDISPLLSGGVDVEAVQEIRIVQNPGAYQLLGNSSAVASVTCTRLQPGGSGLNEKWQVKIDARAYAGVFNLIYTNPGSAVQETGLLAFNLGASDMQAALTALSNIGANNLQVSMVAPNTFVLMFVGSLAATAINVNAISSDPTGLQVPLGRADTLDCRTSALDLILNGANAASIKFEIRATPPGGTEDYIFQASQSLISSIVPPYAVTPAPILPLPVTSIDFSTIATSDPHQVGKPYRSGDFIAISNG